MLPLRYKLFWVIASIIVVYTLFLIYVLVPKVENDLVMLEKKNAVSMLNGVELLAEKSGEDLKAFAEEALHSYERELKDIVDVVHSMFYALKQERITEAEDSKKRIKNELLKLLSSIRYDGNNYLFAVDYNGTVLAHPYFVRGTDVSQVKDVNGSLIVQRFIDTAKKKGEGFVLYRWKRSPYGKKAVEKLTYVRDCKYWHMIIGTGVYINDIRRSVTERRKRLMENLRRVVKQTRIGENGYLYVFDRNKILIHPNADLEGKEIATMTNPITHKPIYRDLIKAAEEKKPFYYMWDKPKDRHRYVYEKISWVRYVPSLDIYIASSVYIDDIYNIADAMRQRIYMMAGGVLFVVLFLSGFVMRRMLSPLSQLDRAAQKIAEGNLNVRTRIQSGDEFERLSVSFNTMIERLHRQIVDLDKVIEEKTQALEKLAVTDVMTGLYNRRYFNEASQSLFALAQRTNEPFSVLMIDIDNFKRINDTYGHLKGDEVIRRLAEIIKNNVRHSDVACRYGGEEFVVLMPDTSQEGAREVAERIRMEAEKEARLKPIRFSVSIGVSQMKSEDTHIESVIHRADEALYKAKTSGKNRVVVL